MLCSDTGSQEVVHVPGVDVALIRDFAVAYRSIIEVGRGNGEIITPVVNGRVSKIRACIDLFREKISTKFN